ncbi:MAG: prepilin-type N-terminal cleavage/methylation domain-containing protein [Verrucomicrobia bacterium]|jgi:prepilin-type N-terminal cleavage/methylation domain-containing protein|nr:prepilin-type N-terminal cleavage/methylation domain-containing protein [Verrucomicrobiota bacterium]
MARDSICHFLRAHKGGLPNDRKCVQAGFSLVEVLIAVVILSTGIVAVLQGLHASLSALDGAADKTRCEMLLRSRIVEAQAVALAGDDPSGVGSRGRFDEPFADYLWRLDVAAAAQPAGNAESVTSVGNLHEVGASVWREGSERIYTASTLVYVPPPPDTGLSGGAL